MDLDHLCMPSDPMRGQPEMTSPLHVVLARDLAAQVYTLPGATAAYIAKLEARVAELEGGAETIAWRYANLDMICEEKHAACAKLEVRVAELREENSDLRGVHEALDAAMEVNEGATTTIRRLSDELASYKAAFIDLGIEMRSFGFVDCWHDGAQEPAVTGADHRSEPGACATARAFSVPALMSGPYMGED